MTRLAKSAAFTTEAHQRGIRIRQERRDQGLAFARRWRLQRSIERLQLVIPRGVTPNRGQGRATAYTGPYPIRSGVTCADWFEGLPDASRGEG